MIRYLLFTYIWLCTIKIFHEFMHVLFLKLYNVPIASIHIGNFFHAKINILYISPIILGGYVEFSRNEFNKLKLRKQLIILLSGVMSSMIIYMLIPDKYFILKALVACNVVMNSVPVKYLGNDGYMCLEAVINKIKISR